MEAGYANGLTATPYTNFCYPPEEENFLIAYAVGRKARWVKKSVDQQEHLLNCLEQERKIKFENTLSPIVIDPHTDTSGLSQKMKDSGCPSDVVRTSWGLEKEISEAKQALKTLNQKQDRITQLKSRIIVYPSQSAQAVKDYEKQGSDDLDVGLRWKNLIDKKGGVDNLNSTEGQLLYQEIKTQARPPSDVERGALYGFGIGHARQGRFKTDGWKYAIFDSLIIGAIAYGISTKQTVPIALPAFVFGFTFSRFFQYVGVYQYNLDHSSQVQNLRTEVQNWKGLQLSWNW